MTFKPFHTKTTPFYRILSLFLATIFITTSTITPAFAQSQMVITPAVMPPIGSLVNVSPNHSPLIVKGIEIHPENPLEFSFLVDLGDTDLEGEALKRQSQRLINYFMAGITVPEEEMWVNLSPYENNRIIPDTLGQTAMGRDLLAQDYLLKQITASLMYPEDELGNAFWTRIHERIEELYGPGVDVPTNVFNKVWIVPESAEIYIHNNQVYLTSSHLKVMLEEDYVAARSAVGADVEHMEASGELLSQTEVAEVVRTILLPEIEEEVNRGENFATLRQIFNSVILASWYKENLRESLLGQVYADQNKLKGIDENEQTNNQAIYQRYLKAFQEGVYNYIKEDYDPINQAIIPRKYFSGGAKVLPIREILRSPKSVEVGGLQRSLPASDAARLSDALGQSRIVKVGAQLTEIGRGGQDMLNEIKTPEGYNPVNIDFSRLAQPSSATDNAGLDQAVNFYAPQNIRIEADVSPAADTSFYEQVQLGAQNLVFAARPAGDVDVLTPDGDQLVMRMPSPQNFSGELSRFVVDPTSQRIALQDQNGQVFVTSIVDSDEEVEIPVLTAPGARTADMRFSQDGELLVTAVGDTVTVWNTETGKEITESTNFNANYRSAALTNDTQSVIAMDAEGVYRIPMNAPNRREVIARAAPADPFVSMDINPRDGKKKIVIGSQNGNVQVYDYETNQPVANSFRGRQPVFHASGNAVAVSSEGVNDGTVTIYDIMSGTSALRHTPGVQGGVNYDLSSDGTRMVTQNAQTRGSVQVLAIADPVDIRVPDVGQNLASQIDLEILNALSRQALNDQARSAVERIKTQLKTQQTATVLASAGADSSTLAAIMFPSINGGLLAQGTYSSPIELVQIANARRTDLAEEVWRDMNARGQGTTFRDFDTSVSYRAAGDEASPKFEVRSSGNTSEELITNMSIAEIANVSKAVAVSTEGSLPAIVFPSINGGGSLTKTTHATYRDFLGAVRQHKDDIAMELWINARSRTNDNENKVFVDEQTGVSYRALGIASDPYIEIEFAGAEMRSIFDMDVTELSAFSEVVAAYDPIERPRTNDVSDASTLQDASPSIPYYFPSVAGDVLNRISVTGDVFSHLEKNNGDKREIAFRVWESADEREQVIHPQTDVIYQTQGSRQDPQVRVSNPLLDSEDLKSVFDMSPVELSLFSIAANNVPVTSDAAVMDGSEVTALTRLIGETTQNFEEITPTYRTDPQRRTVNAQIFVAPDQDATEAERQLKTLAEEIRQRDNSYTVSVRSAGSRSLVMNITKPQVQTANTGDASTMRRTSPRSTQTRGTDAVGGIDLNPQMLDLQIKRDANGIPLPVFDQPIKNMQIEGFLPVIINVTPIQSIPLLLGLNNDNSYEDTNIFKSVQADISEHSI